jgi:hypothetical protein
VGVLLAPVLQLVAARMAGAPVTLREGPSRWAYALRDAVALCDPDWIVTHHDLVLEADAVRAAGAAPEDVLDVELATAAPCAAAVELTRTLAGIYPARVIAASITGPATLAAALGAQGEALLACAEDCGDALAALAAAHAEAGAGRVLVWEASLHGLGAGDAAPAHEPIVRRLALQRVPGVLCGDVALDAGYAARAGRAHATGAALLDPRAFADAEAFEAELERGRALAGEGGVLLTDGPIAEECALELVRRLASSRG